MLNLRVISLLLLVLPGSVHADQVVYEEDFSEIPSSPTREQLPGWSLRFVDETPGTSQHPSDRFLGPFGCPEGRECHRVELFLDELPQHSHVSVSFDLYILQSWDGNETDFGPDLWAFQIDSGRPLIRTTFSNVEFFRDGQQVSDRQSYPDSYPNGDHPLQTGSIEQNTLGYIVDVQRVGPLRMDSVYHFEFDVQHQGDAVSLTFSASGLQPLFDESWGLDNIEVRVGGPRFRRGFVNTDDRLDLSDAVTLLGCLFLGTLCPACVDASDCDDDGRFNIVDPIYLLNHVFLGGPPPPEPFQSCGEDLSADDLSCDSYPACA